MINTKTPKWRDDSVLRRIEGWINTWESSVDGWQGVQKKKDGGEEKVCQFLTKSIEVKGQRGRRISRRVNPRKQ